MNTAFKIHISNVEKTVHFVIHPSKELLDKYQFEWFSGYCKASIGPESNLYTTLFHTYTIAMTEELPDGTIIIGKHVSYDANTSYSIKEDGQLKTQPISGKCIIKNSSSKLWYFRIFNGAGCVGKSRITPGQQMCLPSPEEFLAAISLSLCINGDFPDFFSSGETFGRILGTLDFSLANVAYLTYTISENLSTGEYFLSSPDFSPFYVTEVRA